MSIQSEKSNIRKSILENNHQSPNASQIEADLYSMFKKFIQLKPKQIVAGYYPIRHEFDITHILRGLSSNHTISLPVVDGSNRVLLFRAWDPHKKLRSSNQFDIPEPAASAKEVLPDIMFVPCVGLSSNGHRVGYGYGYYDRTINSLRQKGHEFLAIGVGYDYQLISPLPFDKLDAQLDWVITSSQAFKCRRTNGPTSSI